MKQPKGIKSYPLNMKLPDNYGFKSDPSSKADIASVGGVQCSGNTMMEKRKLPLEHGRDYSESNER